MNIGILGGTFNPPHLGHLILAQDVKSSLELDKIIFIPTNIPPHKENNMVESFHRLSMLRLAVKGNKSFEVLDAEIKRKGVSYTIDTVKYLKGIYTQDNLYLIIGSDLANSFYKWKDSEILKKEVNIIVANRLDNPVIDKEGFRVVDITQVHMSSSEIRNRIRENKPIRYLVDDRVRDYIFKHNLYTSP